VALALALLLPLPAHAAPVVLRFATAAPDGTAWARVFRAMSRDLAEESHGEVTAKWYFGGIAGTETQTLERMQRGQLDVVMSGGMLCMKLSPSMRVLRMLGFFQTRDESSYVLGRLRPAIDAEFAKSGFHGMGLAGLGSDIVFSRTPITSMAELRRTRLWVWDLDDTMVQQLRELGVAAVPLPVEDAARAFEQKRTDGFLAVPTASLAFQWSAQSRYVTELHLGYLPGCMIMIDRAFDSLSIEARRALGVAAARTQARLEQLGREQDAQLLGGLFAKQGAKVLQASPTFSAEFFEASRGVRQKLRDRLVPGELIDRIATWLADYRAEYGRVRR
jgi:TRAP-type C4-dicarboxylate transport system substrate-binding protein